MENPIQRTFDHNTNQSQGYQSHNMDPRAQNVTGPGTADHQQGFNPHDRDDKTYSVSNNNHNTSYSQHLDRDGNRPFDKDNSGFDNHALGQRKEDAPFREQEHGQSNRTDPTEENLAGLGTGHHQRAQNPNDRDGHINPSADNQQHGVHGIGSESGGDPQAQREGNQTFDHHASGVGSHALGQQHGVPRLHDEQQQHSAVGVHGDQPSTYDSTQTNHGKGVGHEFQGTQTGHGSAAPPKVQQQLHQAGQGAGGDHHHNLTEGQVGQGVEHQSHPDQTGQGVGGDHHHNLTGGVSQAVGHQFHPHQTGHVAGGDHHHNLTGGQVGQGEGPQSHPQNAATGALNATGHHGVGTNPSGHPGSSHPQPGHTTGSKGVMGGFTAQTIAGKLQQVAGTVLSSQTMKEEGIRREKEAVVKKEISRAEGLEKDALAGRERAVAHGAHADLKNLGGIPTGH